MQSRARRVGFLGPVVTVMAVAVAAVLTVVGAACSSFSGNGDPGDAGDAGALGDGASTSDGPSSCSADLTTDRLNCGACGHSCLGDPCVGSKCQPNQIDSYTTTMVFGPVLDDARVTVALAVSTGGVLSWCSKAHCEDQRGTLSLSKLPSAIAGNGVDVFVATIGGNIGAGVYRLDGTNALTPITPTDGSFSEVTEVTAVGASDVYFSETDQGTDVIGIYHVTSGGTPQKVVPISGSDRWKSLAVVNGAVYTYDYQSIVVCSQPPCANLAVYAPDPVAREDVTGLTAVGSTLYWVSDKQLLLSCAVGDSCTIATQVAGATQLDNGTPLTLTSSGTDLYITTAQGGIFTCPAATCGTDLHAVAHEVNATVGPVAADATAIYWVETAYVDPSTVDADAPATIKSFRLMRLVK